MTFSALLERALRDDLPFALLRRRGRPDVEFLVGDVVDVPDLASIPLSPHAGSDVLVLVPFRQVVERGFVCHDDAAPLRVLRIRERAAASPDEALSVLPSVAPHLTEQGFDVTDEEYARVVADVVRDEIGRGEGANFVIRRKFLAQLDGDVARGAAALFRSLLVGEPSAYWTFLVRTPGLTMVGATPERHVSVEAGTMTMNPISGTYRYPEGGPTREGLLEFLADPKETEELLMVVDEELKMMSEVCSHGGQVLGPNVVEMGHLAHTEYVLCGDTDMDVRDVLRATMFAATVTGSPVENACRVIARHESTGRGYYSGVAALIGRDDAGRQTLDAPILIRTAYIDETGQVRVPVGATLVRDSVPEHEVAETHAKIGGVLAALGLRRAPVRGIGALGSLPDVAEALARRNDSLAAFWLRPQADRVRPELRGRTALLVDAGDGWTQMMAHVLRRAGMVTEVRRWDEPSNDDADLLVSGPGPGDPRATGDERLDAMRALMRRRRAQGSPLLAVCLSHQLLAADLGLELVRLDHPHQGTQRRVAMFGRDATTGYYNTFAAVDAELDGIERWATSATGHVDALRGPGFTSVQGHLESLLSPDGADLVTDLVSGLLSADLLVARP